MPRKEQRGRLGRRLAIGIYTIALSYLVIVGFASVIPQVFWPESDETFDVGCAEGLRLLYEEIDRVRLDYLTSNTTDPSELQGVLEPWDRRLSALRDRCDEDRVHLLNRYRHRVELNLQKYMREEAPLANRVVDELDAEPGTSAPETAEPAP